LSLAKAMTLESILRQYDFNLRYARALVFDLPEEQMTLVPSKGLDNHPAFTLGHLVSGSAGLAEDLGAPMDMPVGWKELFLRKGPGDPRRPDPDGAKYPSRDALLGELQRQHDRVKTLLAACSMDDLRQPVKWRFSDGMPTLGDLVAFMCITHESMHLGQLAAWRRAMQLPSALATV
jgi:hypothetical protein